MRIDQSTDQEGPTDFVVRLAPSFAVLPPCCAELRAGRSQGRERKLRERVTSSFLTYVHAPSTQQFVCDASHNLPPVPAVVCLPRSLAALLQLSAMPSTVRQVVSEIQQKAEAPLADARRAGWESEAKEFLCFNLAEKVSTPPVCCRSMLYVCRSINVYMHVCIYHLKCSTW